MFRKNIDKLVKILLAKYRRILCALQVHGYGNMYVAIICICRVIICSSIPTCNPEFEQVLNNVKVIINEYSQDKVVICGDFVPTFERDWHNANETHDNLYDAQ